MNTHYEVLGVSEDATAEQIKSAYRRHARTLHPDATGAAESALFNLVTRAYEILGDPAKRAAYDRERVTASAGPTTGPDAGQPQGPGSPMSGADVAEAATRLREQARQANEPAERRPLTAQETYEVFLTFGGSLLVGIATGAGFFLPSTDLYGRVLGLGDGTPMMMDSYWEAGGYTPGIVDVLLAVVFFIVPSMVLFFAASCVREAKPRLANPTTLDVLGAAAFTLLFWLGGWLWFAQAGLVAFVAVGLAATAGWVALGWPLKALRDRAAARPDDASDDQAGGGLESDQSRTP